MLCLEYHLLRYSNCLIPFLKNIYLTLVKIACFQASGGRCGWKGISIALIIQSLDRTYRERMSRPGDRRISIALANRSFDPTKDATSDSAEYKWIDRVD